MSLPLYTSLSKDPPDPVKAFEANIPAGIAPLSVTCFKGSLIREGSARIEGNFKPFTVEAGDLVLMRPGNRCSSMSLTPVEIAVVQVDPMFLVDQVRWARPSDARARRETYKELLGRARQPVHLHLDDTAFLGMAELLAQLAFLSRRSSALGKTISRATELIWMIETMLMPTPMCAGRSQSLTGLIAPTTREDVAAALQTMHERYATKLSIGELAREASLSESALRRAVQASTGFSPREYLHRIRLIRFEELVAEGIVPLAGAARMVGWSSTSHARAMFVRSHGVSPSEFRAETREARRVDWLNAFGG